MGTSDRLVKNTGFVFVAGLVNRLFSFLFIAYAARVLGPEDFGLYALIISVAFIFFYFGNFGIGPMAVREIARDRAKAEELFNHVLSLRTTLVLISFPVLVLIVNLLGYDGDVKLLVYLAGLSAVFTTFSSSFEILYIAFERFKAQSIISAAVSFLRNAANVLVLYLGYGLTGVVVVSFLGALLGAVISGLWVRSRFIRYRLSFEPSVWKGILVQSFPFALISFMQQAGERLNIIFLSKLPGPLPGKEAMGYYNPASSFSRAAMMLPMSLRQVALPAVASSLDNMSLVRGIIDRSTRSLLVLTAFPLVLVTTFFPEEIVTIAFGREYLPSVPAVTIMGWAYAFQVFNVPVTVALSATKDIKRFVPWALLTFVLHVVLAVPLIVYHGFIGAAIAFLALKVFETLFRNHLLRVVWGIKRFEAGGTLRTIFPMAVVFLIVLAASLNSPGPLVLMALTLFLYSAYVLSIKGFRERFVSIINGLWQSP